MVQEALATFTAGLADSPTSSTESAFADVLADSVVHSASLTPQGDGPGQRRDA
jgi:hypothetical protein